MWALVVKEDDSDESLLSSKSLREVEYGNVYAALQSRRQADYIRIIPLAGDIALGLLPRQHYRNSIAESTLSVGGLLLTDVL
jgi:hypothetical protein